MGAGLSNTGCVVSMSPRFEPDTVVQVAPRPTRFRQIDLSQTLHLCRRVGCGGQLIGILWQSHGSSCLGYGPLPRDSTSCDIPAYPADPTRPRLATEPGRPTVQGLRSGDSPRRGATDRRTNAARHDASHEGREVAGFRHE